MALITGEMWDIENALSIAYNDPSKLFVGGRQGAWYDPSTLSTMFQDAAGTIPAAVGQPVMRINDMSGNGRHATQATAGNAPILRVDEGGRRYLDFVSDDWLEAAWSPTTYPLTLAAATLIVAEDNTAGIISVNEGSAAYHSINAGAAAGQAFASNRTTTNDIRLTKTGLTSMVAHTFISEDTASSISLYVDNETQVGLAHSNAFGLPTKIILGSARTITPFFVGRIYGALAISYQPTTTERNDLRAYLASKAGI